jgi:hypothetical protein
VVGVVGECAAIGLGARENIVFVRRISHAFVHVALFVQGRNLVYAIAKASELECVAVQLRYASGDLLTLGVIPRPIANAIARVDCALTLRAQIGVPGLATGAWLSGRSRETLTKRIRAGHTAKIGAFAAALTRYEKTHLGRWPFLATPVLSGRQAGAQHA